MSETKKHNLQFHSYGLSCFIYFIGTGVSRIWIKFHVANFMLSEPEVVEHLKPYVESIVVLCTDNNLTAVEVGLPGFSGLFDYPQLMEAEVRTSPFGPTNSPVPKCGSHKKIKFVMWKEGTEYRPLGTFQACSIGDMQHDFTPPAQTEGVLDKIGFAVHGGQIGLGNVQALTGFPEFLLGHIPNSFTFDCALLRTGELHANISNWLEVSTRDGGWRQITPDDQDLKVLEDYLKTIGFVEQMFKRFPEGMWLELKSMVFSFTGTAGNNFVLYQHLLHERFLRIDL